MTPDRRTRVVVVDDEVANMEALCDTLRVHGYDTVGFVRGVDALDSLRTEAADVLLTDLMMPEMNGVELLSAALELDRNIAGILMTGRGSISTAVQAMQAGAMDYVLKPLKISSLLPVLARAEEVRRLRLENLALRDSLAIQELTQALAHTLDPTELLQKVADGARAHFDADEASVMLLAEDGRYLTVMSVSGDRGGRLLGERTAVGVSIAGRVAATRRPVVTQARPQEEEILAEHPRADILTSLSLPMMTRGKLVGVINVNHTSKANDAPPGQLKAFNVFANAAAASIEAARLFDEERRSYTRYAEILNTAADGVISIDDDQRIVIFNRGAETIFGYAASEMIGRRVDTLIPGLSPEGHHERGRSLDEGPEGSRTMAARQRLLGRRKDGREISVEIGMSKHEEDGRVVSTAVVRDVTQRLLLEDQLRQAQKMEAVGQLTGGIAHDFNNVLTVIISNAESIAKGTRPDSSSAEDVAELLAAARSGASLVARLLQFSRRGTLAIQPESLGRIVSDVATMVRRILPGSIELTVVDETDADDLVLADRGSVEQMLLNLCTNARDAMPDGGKLDISCSLAHLDEQDREAYPWVAPGPYVRLEVADSGAGIDETALTRLFEPFFTTKAPGKGTGLGLAMVYGLMKRHRGMPLVSSELGEGTRVRLFFPLMESDRTRAASGTPVVAPDRPPGRGETILLAEDNHGIRRATMRALERRGYRVLAAPDGAEALRLARESHEEVRLVISDLAMPVLDGHGLARALREAGVHAPIVFTSGDTRAFSAGEQLGDVSFLQKPWTLDDLWAHVRRRLDGHSGTSGTSATSVA